MASKNHSEEASPKYYLPKAKAIYRFGRFDINRGNKGSNLIFGV